MRNLITTLILVFSITFSIKGQEVFKVKPVANNWFEIGDKDADIKQVELYLGRYSTKGELKKFKSGNSQIVFGEILGVLGFACFALSVKESLDETPDFSNALLFAGGATLSFTFGRAFKRGGKNKRNNALFLFNQNNGHRFY